MAPQELLRAVHHVAVLAVSFFCRLLRLTSAALRGFKVLLLQGNGRRGTAVAERLRYNGAPEEWMCYPYSILYQYNYLSLYEALNSPSRD